jgi:hypothetical protein
MNARLGVVSLVAITAGTAGMAKGVVIASYPFAGASTASTDTEPNSTAGTFTLGPASVGSSPAWGFTATNPGGSFGSAFARSHTVPNTEAAAVTNGSYFSFTVTPSGGYELDLTSLTFSTAYGTDGTTLTGSTTATFFVRTSLDGFAANVGSSFVQNSENAASPLTFNSRSVDLTGPLFQNIAAIAEVRIYVFDGSTSQNRVPRVTNVVLNGEVPLIPEPSALAALSMLGGLLLRRRAM